MTDNMLDPHLTDEIAKAGANGEVEAVLLVQRNAVHPANGQSCSSDGQNAPEFVERISATLHEQPTALRCLPNLGVVVVRGSGNLIQHLLEAEEVVSASSNSTSDFFLPGT